MYQVKLLNRDGGEYVLHDPRDPDLFLIDPVLTLNLNRSGEFSFSISPAHPHIEKIRKMSSEIEVLQDGKVLYAGRPLNQADNMENVAAITCEGVLAYLLDSVVRPFEYQGSLPGFFRQLLDSHNAQVDERKRFKLGEITVTDSNDYINRSNSAYADTFSTITEKLINTHGGYLWVRFEPDGRYLDYLADYEHTNSQVIEFGENLLDLTKYIDPDDLMTAIIPLGAETEDEGINGTKLRVNITSVNGGLDYLADEEAAKEFGFVCRAVKFDDVTLPQNLKAKGQAYLDEHKGLVRSLELTAVDLHLLNVDVESIALGDLVRVRSSPHKLDSPFLVSQLKINLTDPGANTLSLGKTLETMTDSTAQIQNEVMSELQKAADGITAKLLVANTYILGEVSALDGELTELSQAMIKKGEIKLQVVNDSQGAYLVMKAGNVEIKSGHIDLTGLVTFSDLEQVNGQTVINGGNITTGTIDAQKVSVGNFYGGFKISTGNDGSKIPTLGAKLYGGRDNDLNYFIATTRGVRMQSADEDGNMTGLFCIPTLIKASEPIDTSSDRNLKNSISYDLGRFEKMFRALKPACYRYNNGTSQRLHNGFVAQDVEDAVNAGGLTTQDFAGLVIERKEDLYGRDIPEYSLRYSEFISLNTFFIQQALDRIEVLERRMSELENQVKGA